MLFLRFMLYDENSADMENNIRIWKITILAGLVLFFSEQILAQEYTDTINSATDFYRPSDGYIHRFSLEVRPGCIFPTNDFLKGDNRDWRPIRKTISSHLKYSFQPQPDTYPDRIYGRAYQGAGLAYYSFNNHQELGSPIAFYLFQGARIVNFTPRLSLNYEWNFGMSAGWEPYDYNYNSYNKIIGSKLNAYINLNFYLNWILSNQFDLTTGFDLTHFSNGNTKFPNAGLNTTAFKVGIAYNFNRKSDFFIKPAYRLAIPYFPRHISYDLVLFGSWRRKGVVFGDEQVASPNAYTVFGFNFAPMYNLGYKLRVGISLDGFYDGSANVYTEDYIIGTEQQFFKPPLNKQLALGLSGRGEYVMPYFTVGIGLGANVLHGGGDLKSFYQILALKIELTRNSFLHVGYSLSNFHDPNFLMLGIGFRFNNKYPTFHR